MHGGILCWGPYGLDIALIEWEQWNEFNMQYI